MEGRVKPAAMTKRKLAQYRNFGQKLARDGHSEGTAILDLVGEVLRLRRVAAEERPLEPVGAELGDVPLPVAVVLHSPEWQALCQRVSELEQLLDSSVPREEFKLLAGRVRGIELDLEGKVR